MCKCTPNIKTPWCGRQGCEIPKQKPITIIPIEDLSIEEMVIEIGSKKMLRIEQWRDDYRHWRAGIEWYTETNDDEEPEFLCEYPTLEECLRAILKYMRGEPINGHIYRKSR